MPPTCPRRLMMVRWHNLKHEDTTAQSGTDATATPSCDHAIAQSHNTTTIRQYGNTTTRPYDHTAIYIMCCVWCAVCRPVVAGVLKTKNPRNTFLKQMFKIKNEHASQKEVAVDQTKGKHGP